MRYKDEKWQMMADMPNRAILREMLADSHWTFSIAELEAIIQNEFFDDANALDAELVDAALTRLLCMYGKSTDEETMKREREALIRAVLRKATGIQK